MPRRKDERTPKQLAQDRKLAASADGRAALQEIAERAAFVETNTARLRELRLAKKAREVAEAAKTPPAKPARKTSSTKP